MSTLIAARRRPSAIAIAVVLAAGLLYIARPQAQAHHQPADKVAVAGSMTKVFKPEEGPVTLLSQTLRTSNTDLILQVSLECSIITNIKTVGTHDDRAAGTLEIWVEIDGEPVPVASNDVRSDPPNENEVGQVTACHRAYERRTVFAEDEEHTIETFFDTKSTHGFNWLALNLRPGVYTIELKGALTQDPDDGIDATNLGAEVVVGKRTLIGIPTKLPHDATIEPGPGAE